MGRALLVMAGCICLGLGAAGVFLPLLPTTPFLLLAAACFLRSSDRLHAWLLNHRWFGTYIRNYREHRAITLRAKVITLALLWITLGYSAVWVTSNLWVRVLLGVVGVCVTTHILSLRTMTAEMMAESADAGSSAARPEGHNDEATGRPDTPVEARGSSDAGSEA